MWTSSASAAHQVNGVVRAALLLVSVPFATQPPAQSLRVTAANASAPDAVYDVLFSSPADDAAERVDGGSFHALPGRWCSCPAPTPAST